MEKLSGLAKDKSGYQVELEIFSGPLELLLHLIKIQEIDIYNIPIAQITKQFLEYLEMMEELNLEVTGEFLVMAATLMYIKSKMLLPKELISLEEEEEEEPRTELVEALLEYKRYKQAAEHLGELAKLRQEIFARGEPEVIEDDLIEANIFDLMTAFRKILNELGSKEPVTEISRSPVTVKEKIKEILDLIKSKKAFSFGELFINITLKLEAVVCFLAMLELIKQKKILVRQSRIFGEIKILEREK